MYLLLTDEETGSGSKEAPPRAPGGEWQGQSPAHTWAGVCPASRLQPALPPAPGDLSPFALELSACLSQTFRFLGSTLSVLIEQGRDGDQESVSLTCALVILKPGNVSLLNPVLCTHG